MNIAILPYALVAGLLWSIALAGTSYHYGAKHTRAELALEAETRKDNEAKVGAAASTNLEAGNAKAKVVYRTITQTVDKIVDRPVYRNVCLDDDGLRAANDALAGGSQYKPPAKGSDDAALPRPDGQRLRPPNR